ncbi:uncharacterized protein E0L32_012289 [Thyridium curvatum]|uniref:RRM domain-containing protein n=1 Tax=Thyridium curvatum TaxID=1093900 RepID=A0A507B1S4_9PEZI|nr:uncharacterized protein E0L32_012289 [Thyridium curvatum]TPX17055.1 hypothetical protein E0L32_012289 [Thyridium curvatum]
MSGKLDQSLDEILSTQRRSAGRRRSTRRSTGQPARAAPVGGIQKNTKPARGNTSKTAPAKAAGATGVSKIVVSNLPKDVSESQIKPLVARTIQTPPCVADRPRGVNASGVEQVLVLLEITCAGLPGKQAGLFAYSQTFGKTWSVSQGCVGPSSFALFLAGHQISGSSAVSIGSEQSAQHESIAASVQITLQHEYFGQSVGHVKRVELSYGPGGVSRGIATVTFSHADGASKAFQELNGLLIDNRPVKVEVVVASADLIPQPKTLGQRISQPKAQPKSAASDKRANNTSKAAGAAKGAKKPRRGRNSRPAKKTAEELDSEMADYFTGNTANATGDAAAPAAAAPAAAGGDAPMEDEIM